MTWLESSSFDPLALAVVDGTGQFSAYGPHYSRRTPGSKSFTGIGREVVLITSCGKAVWSVVYQSVPAPRGSGNSRGRSGDKVSQRFVWRNNVFRNLGAGLSSSLIRDAVELTYVIWVSKYGNLPNIRLRTEVDTTKVKSTNPGACYQKAGWTRGELKKGKLFWYAPERL